MSDVLPTGPLSRPFAGLAKLLAASETFREIVKPSDATEDLTEAEALAFIDYPKSLRDGESARPQIPLAVITQDDGDEWSMDNFGQTSGTLLLSLLIAIPDELVEDPKNALQTFNNQVGAILVEMLEKANTIDGEGIPYWNLVGVRQVLAPAECDDKLRPDGVPPYFGATYEARWV